MTILSGLALVIVFFFIFVPIFRIEKYNSEIKQIKIKGLYKNEGTLESCTSCKNFTVREAVEYNFNGNYYLLISSHKKTPMNNCQKYYAKVFITGIEQFSFTKFFNQTGN
jgi:flagellar biosynthesis protein FliP